MASIESRDYVFEVRHEDVWMKPYRVEFYDLHRWNGKKIHWNCHDIRRCMERHGEDYA